MQIFDELKTRGVEDVLFISMDGVSGLGEGAKAIFKDVVSELEKKENSFTTIAIDLIEDLFEHCRLYMYNKLKIEHEQDAGFGKGWDMVRTEFLSTMKRLKNLGYRIIYISKELKTEINLKNGAKLTSFSPNVNDKVMNVLEGTVTMTVRAFMNNRGRFLQLAKQENVTGGGRFNFVHDTCELNMDAFIKELKLAQEEEREEVETAAVAEKSGQAESEAENVPSESNENSGGTVADDTEVAGEPAEEKPKRRTRKRRAE